MQNGSTTVVGRTNERSTSLQNGIRQRAMPTTVSMSEHRKPALDEPEPSNMSAVQGTILIISSLGVVSFTTLAALFSARYAFFGFRGNMEQAATSCWQTAFLFGIIAVAAAVPSVSGAFRAWRKARLLRKKQVLPVAYRR